jgi:membrane protein YdbS with pleckstrin-like domain
MSVAMSESLVRAAMGAGAVLLLIVIVFGILWPRFMAWAAHFVTVVTGVVVIAVLIYGVLEYRELRSELRAKLAGESSGLSENRALERQRPDQGK